MKRIAMLVFLVGILFCINQPSVSTGFTDYNYSTEVGLQRMDSIYDGRDGTWYKVVLVDSLYWLNENLSYISENSGLVTLSRGQDDVYIRVYSFEDSKIVCPTGWRLPTVSEFDHLITTVFDTVFTGLATLNFDWQSISDNSAGFKLDKTAFLHKRKTMSKESFNLWLDDKNDQNAYHVHMYDTDKKDKKVNLTIFRHTHESHNPKKNRKFPVRCVCELEEFQFLEAHKLE